MLMMHSEGDLVYGRFAYDANKSTVRRGTSSHEFFGNACLTRIELTGDKFISFTIQDASYSVRHDIIRKRKLRSI